VPVALAYAVLDLTGSKADLGYVLAARLVPQLGFLLVGGIWADRLPRHHVLVVSNTCARSSGPHEAARRGDHVSGEEDAAAPRSTVARSRAELRRRLGRGSS